MNLEQNPIYTRVGHTGATELRFWGHRVFAELLGKTSVCQLLMCGVVGRILEKEDELLIDDIMAAMTSADPRLWPFKITRLGASSGSAALGVAITMISSEGAIFGATRFRAIAEVLIELGHRNLDDDGLESTLKAGAVGFGILYGKHDARFDALAGQIQRRGRADRHFMRVALQAVRVARTKLNVEPHVFVAVAAACLDLGMTPYQIGVFGMLPLFHDALANATEGAQQQPRALRCLPAHQVKYVGREPRISARLAAQLTQ